MRGAFLSAIGLVSVVKGAGQDAVIARPSPCRELNRWIEQSLAR
jgi:hypothetical protein